MPRSAVPYVLHLDVTRGPGKLPRRVSAALIRAIAEGQLADGDIMPSTRTLAAGIGVARSVVVEAYEELVAAGFLSSKAGSATRVERGARDASLAGAFSSPLGEVRETAVVNVARAEVEFDLLPGFPDISLVDERDWGRAWRLASRDSLSRQGDRYDTRTDGLHPELRRQLVDHLRLTRGLVAEPRDVFVFAGINAAIRTLTKAVAHPEQALAFEDPGYATGRRAFVSAGSPVRPVPVDDEGLVVDQLRPDDWGVYVTPAHQFPLGARLSVARRSALLEWAQTHQGVVFEDDYDGEFRYDVAPMPAIRAMTAGADRVIYLGTASKVLARDMRVAWAVVPAWLSDQVRDALTEEGETVSATSALAMAHFIQSGALLRQISLSHRTYAARRGRLADACRQVLPYAQLHGVDAGLHLVLTFDAKLNDVEVVEDLARVGLACAPLSPYYDSETTRPMSGLVCGYSRLPETKAGPAVARIRDVLESHMGA